MVSFVSVQAQIIGETDAVSIPDYKFTVQSILNTSGRALENPYPEDPCSEDSYACGYLYGMHVGYEDGLNAANSCNYYDKWIADELENTSFEFLSGYYDGWWATYDQGYNDRITDKAATCFENEEFSEFHCSCICINHEYYFDGDKDNYYDPNVTFKYQCDPPGDSWKIANDFDGVDCNDTDKTVWKYNDCGFCTSDDGLTVWYYDEDGDGHHSQTIESCSKPTSGTSSSWKTATNGSDCDDDDYLANIDRTWYYFNDDDNYYDRTSDEEDAPDPCLRPSSGISARWRTDSGLGPDCNSNDPNIFGPITWYYDYDGDGYHDASKTVTQCDRPTSGIASRWVEKSSLPDCDDQNASNHTLNACGVCDNGTPTKAYLDFDGDGYHSAEIIVPSSFVPFAEYSGDDPKFAQYENTRSPCADIPLMVSPKFLNGLPIFKNTVFTLPLHSELSSYSDEQSVLNEHATFFTQEQALRKYHILDPPEPRYDLDLIEDEENWAQDMIFSDYFNLPNGQKLWAQSYWGPHSSLPTQVAGANWLNEINNIDYDLEVYILLSGGWKNANFIISSTLGEDCDDFDANIMAHGNWYYDRDEDGYHSTERSFFDNCAPDDNKMILLSNSLGVDCDDAVAEKTIDKTWYYFGDEDSYYGISQVDCGNPGLGTPEVEHWSTHMGSGEDCDDTDSQATTADKVWYQDLDGDNYYGNSQESCKNPGTTDEEKARWTLDEGLGEECNDSDPAITITAVDFYIDLDGDGYHSVKKSRDCGTPSFSSADIEGGSFPEELIPTEPYASVEIPGTSEVFLYGGGYLFPESVLSFESLGLDCDDLNSAILAYGEWYPDRDKDGYHEDGVGISSCSPPEPDLYIRLEDSKGIDCNDENSFFTARVDWYWDADGDGFYTDTQKLCYDPGIGWNRSSSLGPDIDDTDPFTPALTPIGHEEDFVIASLLKTEINELGEEVVYYDGEYHSKEDIKLVYRGVEFAYDDLLFDHAKPLNRMQPDKLLIGNKAIVLNAEIVTNESVASSSSESAESSSSSARTIVTTEVEFDKLTPWQQFIFDGSPGYTNVPSDISANFTTAGFSTDINNYAFQPMADFSAFAAHYSNPNFSLPFTVQLRRFEAVVSREGFEEYILGEEQIVGTATPSVIINVMGRPDKRLEYVVSIHDDSFKASTEELQDVKFLNENRELQNKWVDDAGNWINPEDEETYNTQLGELRKYRQWMVRILERDYDSSPVITPQYPPGSALYQEIFPEYVEAEFGILSTWMDFFALGHHLGHQFEMPKGTWDPAVTSGDESWHRWDTKSPSSVAGIIDGSLTKVKDLADRIKMAQSLRHKSTREKIYEAAIKFNVGEQMSGMKTPLEVGSNEQVISMADPLGSDIEGQSTYQQYHDIGEVTAYMLDLIHEGWSSVGKSSKQISLIEASNPAARFDQDRLDFIDAFEGTINKSDEFGVLDQAPQEQLTTDLATSIEDELGVAMASNSGLINAWSVMTALESPQRLDTQFLNQKLAEDEDGWLEEEAFQDFYDRVSLSITDPDSELTAMVSEIQAIDAFLETCRYQGWASYQSQGIVPRCLWLDVQDTKIPFLAGVIDGAYLEYEGITEFSATIDQLQQGLLNLVKAYTIQYWDCEGHFSERGMEYERVLTRLKELDQLSGPWAWLEEQYQDYHEDRLLEYLSDCQKMYDLRDEVAELQALVQDWSAMQDFILEIAFSVDTYLTTIQSSTNQGYYERGKLVIPAATVLIEGVGALSKIPRARASLQGMKGLINEGKWNIFTGKLDDFADAKRILDDIGEEIIPASLRNDTDFLINFDDVSKNNNLGLDADGVSNLLKSPSTKVDAVTGQPLKWDNPDGVLDAIRRSSDSGIDGVSISHKKFPEPAEGNSSFVLDNAKQYQKEASGDAALSFDKGGRSFDNVTPDGKLIDRKYGHSSSVFNEIDDGFGGTTINIKDQNRANSILQQAAAQVNAAGGSPIRWEISTDLGARGIGQLFNNSNNSLINAIEVVHVTQITIIP